MKSKWDMILPDGNGCFTYQRKSDDDLPALTFETLDSKISLDTSEALMLKRLLEAFLGDSFGN